MVYSGNGKQMPKVCLKKMGYSKNIRLKALQALGNKCVRCGFADPRALLIDHVNSDGAVERKNKHGNTSVIGLYSRISNKNVDLSRYQALCANCSRIKSDELNEIRGNPNWIGGRLNKINGIDKYVGNV